MGMDINYSGTAAAMFEGANLGAKSLALSTAPDSIQYALSKLDDVWEYIEKNSLYQKNNLYNINIPKNGKEFIITKQGGRFFCDTYIEQEKDMFLPTGRCIYNDSGSLTFDTDAVMHGFISVTPMTIERTNQKVYDELSCINK
jgi:5'-nucleotidase